MQRDNIPLYLDELAVEDYLVDIDLDWLADIKGISLVTFKSSFLAFKDGNTIEIFNT